MRHIVSIPYCEYHQTRYPDRGRQEESCLGAVYTYTHTAYVQCMHSVCIEYVQRMYNVCIVYVQRMYSVCTVYV